ncbi:MAG: nicotinamide-nucleotide amidohydrolase family protein [Cytophagales bacterium]|nr:nicotinamide-nucleotide amidohydrolase family protein [Cytophagales bacterium]
MAQKPTSELVEQLATKLQSRGLLLATAESCTGGMIAAACTDLAGSSAWFDRGFITYSNDAKTAMLGVSSSMIRRHGAVSEEVAAAMAGGCVRAIAEAMAGRPYPAGLAGHVVVAVTGVAGPGGGTDLKPVGTVCFGFFVRGAVTTCTQHFAGDRAAVRQQTTAFALSEVLRLLG